MDENVPMPESFGPSEITEGRDSYRFHLNKREMRVRFENETEHEVVVVIEPILAVASVSEAPAHLNIGDGPATNQREIHYDRQG